MHQLYLFSTLSLLLNSSFPIILIMYLRILLPCLLSHAYSVWFFIFNPTFILILSDHRPLVRSAMDLVRESYVRFISEIQIPEGPYDSITPNTWFVTWSLRLTVLAVGASLAQTEALRPRKHRPAIVGARVTLARVKPAHVFSQGSPQVATFGHGTWHVGHQIRDGWHLADSRSVSSYLDTAGSCWGYLQDFKGTRTYVWSYITQESDVLKVMDALKEYNSAILVCLYCFYFSNLGFCEPVENQPSGIACLKIQDTIDDVGFAYTWSLPCETSLHCLQELSSCTGKRSLILCSSRFCCLPQVLCCCCWVAAEPARELGSSVHSQQRWHAVLSEQDGDTRGLLFCFSLAAYHSLQCRPDKGKTTRK